MSSFKTKADRRRLIKRAGVASITAAAATFGGILQTSAKADDDNKAIKKYWEKNN